MRRATDRPLEIFVDLTGGDADATTRESWPRRGWFPARTRLVTCAARPATWTHLSKEPIAGEWRINWSDSAVGPCGEAMVRAAADQAWLLILRGPVAVTDEALMVMRQALEQDPLFGCAVARIQCEGGCCVQALSRHGLAPARWIARRALAEIQEIALTPEVFGPCLLVAPDVAAEFGELDARFSGLPAALLYYFSRARRCGFRAVVANRAVVAVSGLRCDNGSVPATAVPDNDRSLLKQLIPDSDRLWRESRAASHERFEALVGEALRAAGGAARPSLLLDIRNVIALHNGTTQAVLGSLSALHRLAPAWKVSVLANPAGLAFHGLEHLCRGWEVHTSPPAATFTAALRLSQPWHIQEMVDLHQAAMFNVYFMLDTISWDVLYAAPPGLDGTWSFLAEYVDGLLFDSAFTETRFLARFDASVVPRSVCHYSFDPADYVRSDAARTPTSDYVLVIGNELDHKDAVATLELLSKAFPFQPLVSLGPRLSGSLLLKTYRSGNLTEAEVHRLYAGARFIVFPSFYEGFGFPVVTALAYGKTLIARRSDLLHEIAERCPAGRLVTFGRRDELVSILGRLLHGEAVPEEPLGTAVSGRARGWQEVAVHIMGFLDALVRQPVGSRWLERERAVNQLLAFRT